MTGTGNEPDTISRKTITLDSRDIEMYKSLEQEWPSEKGHLQTRPERLLNEIDHRSG
jgi:hypothetical protein